MNIENFFGNNQRIAIAFSGGVDSSYLLYAAKKAGCDVRAYFVKSQFQPEFELEDAQRLAEQLDVPLTVKRLDVLADEIVQKNPADRCYHCKRLIFTHIQKLARADGYDTLCDGTNADDDESDRPGFRALRELGVVSPLRLCGLTKSEIRGLSERAGLFTHDKPAYACLATRIPADTPITGELLAKIERGENTLFSMGFTDFRIRLVTPNGARIQLKDSQFEIAVLKRTEIITALERDFDSVLLDLIPRGCRQ